MASCQSATRVAKAVARREVLDPLQDLAALGMRWVLSRSIMECGWNYRFDSGLSSLNAAKRASQLSK